jgi:hypothetical protein
MTLTADDKWAVMMAIEACTDLADVNWIGQQVRGKREQLQAKLPRGPSKGFLGFGGN